MTDRPMSYENWMADTYGASWPYMNSIQQDIAQAAFYAGWDAREIFDPEPHPMCRGMPKTGQGIE